MLATLELHARRESSALQLLSACQDEKDQCQRLDHKVQENRVTKDSTDQGIAQIQSTPQHQPPSYSHQNSPTTYTDYNPIARIADFS